MVTTWGAYREQLRRTLLRDTNSASYRWTDEELRDYCWWALDALCAHTAVATATAFTDVSGSSFSLPDNVFDDLELTGLIYTGVSGSYEYLNPIRYTDGMKRTSTTGFYVWPDDTLNLQSEITSTTLTIRYFAYYNHPYADSDVITVKPHLVPALSYRIAAFALVGLGTKSANIRQWGQKPDTGNPEDNSLREQQEWYMSEYTKELNTHPRQIRENYFRDNT